MHAFIRDNQIAELRDSLTGSWSNSDNTVCVCNMELLTDAELNEFGWFEVAYTNCHTPDAYHITAPAEYSVVDGRPVGTYANELKPVKDVVAELVALAQQCLDSKARSRGYDGMLALCSYAQSINPKYAAEGLAGINWRDQTWSVAYAITGGVADGSVSVPDSGIAAWFVAQLPVMRWPDEVSADAC